MSNADILIKAAINRLSVRMAEGLTDVAEGIVDLAQDAPERIQKEWELFQEEVREEADRLRKEEEDVDLASGNSDNPDSRPQEQIDELRSKVAQLSRKIEALS